MNGKCDLMSRDVQVCSRWPLKKSGRRCGYLKMLLTVAISHFNFALYLKLLFRCFQYRVQSAQNTLELYTVYDEEG